jgi:mono/diheme cytochrome c family protein
MNRDLLGILLALVCAVAIACSSARRGEPIAGPMTALDPSAQRGERVFMERCNKCHPGGEAGLGPALNDKPFPSFLVRFQVRHGLGAMPSFSEERISDEQLDDVLEYLGALSDREPDRAAN